MCSNVWGSNNRPSLSLIIRFIVCVNGVSLSYWTQKVINVNTISVNECAPLKRSADFICLFFGGESLFKVSGLNGDLKFRRLSRRSLPSWPSQIEGAGIGVRVEAMLCGGRLPSICVFPIDYSMFVFERLFFYLERPLLSWLLCTPGSYSRNSSFR